MDGPAGCCPLCVAPYVGGDRVRFWGLIVAAELAEIVFALWMPVGLLSEMSVRMLDSRGRRVGRWLVLFFLPPKTARTLSTKLIAASTADESTGQGLRTQCRGPVGHGERQELRPKYAI